MKGDTYINGHLVQDCHILALMRIAAHSICGDGCVCMNIFDVFTKLFFMPTHLILGFVTLCFCKCWSQTEGGQTEGLAGMPADTRWR